MAEKAILYEGTGIDATHGFNFEYQATCLAYLRCVKLHKEFQINRNSGVKSFAVANNVKEFCPIDDVVIRVEYFEGEATKTKSIFVQCKHAADPEKNPSKLFQNILDNDKMVQKYFDKFIDIHKKFESGNENELQPEQSKTNIHNFFCDVFKDCEFVFYSNVKPEITSTSKFELSTNVAQNNIAEKLLGTMIDVRCYRLKYSESVKLKCDPSDEHLKEMFCENFTVMPNQENLESHLAEEIKLILHSDQRICDIRKFYIEEIHSHFNVPDLRQILSEESGVVEAIQAYVTLKSQSEDKVDQFKRNSSFQNLFTEETVRSFEQRLSGTNSKEPICSPTKFMELEKRKIIQVFKLSDDVCLLIISSEVDERNWYLARETKTYNKWKKVKICADFLMRNLIALKPNEIFVQIVNTCEECDPIAYFETLSPETEQILLSSKVCFQGKLQELGQCSDGKWKNFIDEDTICKMLEDKHVLNIGKPLAKLDFYIDRKFKIRIINAKKLPYINLSQNFQLLLFSERNIKIPNMGKTFVWCENMPEARNMLQNIPEETKDDIHLCFYNAENNSKNSELIYSLGIKSKLVETENVEENYLLQQRESSKIVILSDIAGMGKTTTLLSIARKFKAENPSHWVFFLELNKYLNELRNGKFPDKLTAVNFVARNLLKLKSMDLKIFSYACIETGNVVLCFDAFDEISPDAEKIFPKLLKALEETKIKSIIVSSRPNFARYLEQQFYQKSVEFVPFKFGDKVQFLLKKWRTMMENENKEINVNEADMEGAINKILGGISCESNSIEELLGIPLQMRMISEIYFDTFITLLERKVGAENLKINLYSLYDKFITLQTIRYCTEKEGTMWEQLTEEKQILHLKEKLNGVEIFCTDFVCPKLKLPNKFEDVGLKLCNGIGLLSTLKPPVFIHRTFAEFLAAKYIVSQIVGDNNKQSQEILQFFYLSILVEEKYETLRTFINATFGHEVFKDRDINTADIKICKGIDGNTVLHIAALEGNIEILEKLLVLNNFNINETNSRQQTPLLLACQKAKTSETVKYLINYPECLVNAEDNEGDSALHYASRRRHTDIIKILLDRDPSLLNKQNKNGDTPLHLASYDGNCDAVKELVNNNECQVDTENNDGCSALHVASELGHTDIMKILLDRDLSLLNKQKKRGYTPLHLASYFGNCDAVKELLNIIECQVDTEDIYGNSAIHHASQQGHTNIIKILLDRNPSLLNKQNIRGETLLHLASDSGKCDAVKELLTTIGCQVDAEDNAGNSAIHYASRRGHTDIIKILLDPDLTLLNKQNKFGETPLHLASIENQGDAVEELLTTIGCQVDAENIDGNSALHYASLRGHTYTIKILLARDRSLLIKQNKYGETPLHLASHSGYCDAVEELLTTFGCQVDEENNEGYSALHYASLRGHTDIIKILLDRDRSLLNKQNKYGVTPLHLASHSGYCDAVKELVNNNECQVDTENKYGYSALHYASEQGHTDIIKILLDRDLTLLNKQNKRGDTPLHLASYRGNCDFVKELLNIIECQVDTEDIDGNSAIHHASRMGHTNVIKILLDRDLSLLNKQNIHGESPLHLAASFMRFEAVNHLLSYSECSVDIKDKAGKSALNIAQNRGFTKIVNSILERDTQTPS